MKWIILITIFLLSACSEPIEKVSHNENLSGILWMQHSAEYQAISYQTYKLAENQLKHAVERQEWTAIPSDDLNKPPALIVYIDEVILQSVRYNAGLLKSHLKESKNTWNNWVNQVSAEKLKGSVYFLKKAHAMGIKIFYITRRTRTVIETTRLNLRNLGFPLEAEFETILTPKDIDITGKLRRELVAKNYRVIMILGHDLMHFSEKYFEVETEERIKLLKTDREKFGKEWIIFPNPIYGSWKHALYYFDYQIGEEEKHNRKMELLEY